MKTITTAEFEKQVEIEAAYLRYQDRMNPDEARQKAIETVSAKYQKE